MTAEQLTCSDWFRSSEAAFVVALVAAASIGISWAVRETAEPPPLASPILAPFASLVTTYCPDRLEVFELRTAVETCLEMAEDICWLAEDDFEPNCFAHHAENCTIGNTQRSGAP